MRSVSSSLIRSPDTRHPPPSAALRDAILCWLTALLLTGLAVAAVLVSGSCEYACPSALERLLPAAALLALNWFPLTPATAVLLRRRARYVSTFTWPAGAIGLVLTSYGLAVAGLAWDLMSDGEIHGLLAWAMYGFATIVAWIALELILVAAFARR
jgi:hypothetical protein